MWTLAKILAAVVVYGTAIEPRFVLTEREPASIPALPASWEGKDVAVFADLQIGMWWANRDAARKVVRRISWRRTTSNKTAASEANVRMGVHVFDCKPE